MTSGGDSPGMNACIRAVTRAAIYNGLSVVGYRRGYEGMIDNDFTELNSSAVSNIIQRGGTILKSARSPRFRTMEGMRKVYDNLKKEEVDGMVVIGGDGTFAGAKEFYEHFDTPFVGIPGTIDNDLYGTDFALGYDTAINTVMEAVDKIRDTANSHDRLFFVEVMGRDAGFIALRTGIASGAEAILLPETKTSIDELVEMLEAGAKRKKTSSIVIVSEGDEEGNAFEIAHKVKEKYTHYDTRVTVLGHIQRGGSPTCMDRVLAGRLGVGAVEALLEGKHNIMVGMIGGKVCDCPFEKAIKHHQGIDESLLRLAEILST